MNVLNLSYIFFHTVNYRPIAIVRNTLTCSKSFCCYTRASIWRLSKFCASKCLLHLMKIEGHYIITPRANVHKADNDAVAGVRQEGKDNLQYSFLSICHFIFYLNFWFTNTLSMDNFDKLVNQYFHKEFYSAKPCLSI